MATLNARFPTLLDRAKAVDPDGSIARVVELMTQENALLQDAVFMEGNLPTGHRFSSRVGLPTVGWRKLNEGIASSKSIREQIDEASGMLEGMSEVDVELAKLNGNEAAFRASEDDGFIQAMSNKVETSLLYSSTASEPEAIHGLTARLNSSTGRGGSQIVKVTGGASGNDQTSMWAVCWGPESVFGFYPKGSKVGLETNDMGIQLVDDGTGKRFRAYTSHWSWKLGVCVKDYRQLARACNIDLGTEVASNDTLVPALIDIYNKIRNPRAGRLAFYVNRTVSAMLWKQARNATKNATLSYKEVEGAPVLTFMGYPIRTADALLDTESPVV